MINFINEIPLVSVLLIKLTEWRIKEKILRIKKTFPMLPVYFQKSFFSPSISFEGTTPASLISSPCGIGNVVSIVTLGTELTTTRNKIIKIFFFKLNFLKVFMIIGIKLKKMPISHIIKLGKDELLPSTE
jgi:hypothetical protein